ncbi:heme-binding protein [Flavobacterium frigoris]|uniref:Heme-binding protein n=1 Tax=Flavobacterium frigoris (strain PS1) TaxID=1086011 RepID=H7FSF3_FLAFP|nr:heme-binding protein [Flavobacterium frigoris]EIA08796.1 hypothetical protein HJ01_02518 [Flavobacterium frigoris PS1]
MKNLLLVLAFIPIIGSGQHNSNPKEISKLNDSYIKSIDNLTLDAAYILTNRVMKKAFELDKNVSIAVLDASANIILIIRGNNVGIHNTEAARRKAYTALSTKTSTLELLQKANSNSLIKNLNTLPELLLLSGGLPIWYKGNVVGSIGVAGGGSPENDDLIAKSASINEKGITTSK